MCWACVRTICPLHFASQTRSPPYADTTCRRTADWVNERPWGILLRNDSRCGLMTASVRGGVQRDVQCSARALIIRVHGYDRPCSEWRCAMLAIVANTKQPRSLVSS